ncbi:hypothetical protein [Pedococcus sp. 5OH_020]|uniref:hypothetical protein n=1 Tax=Pedococcus sp. 5OH_020 TaxID=2989814 RepID=UPI0022E9DE6A|nr:hypothetical protein [Pedococcus sp. 5OH_020]
MIGSYLKSRMIARKRHLSGHRSVRLAGVGHDEFEAFAAAALADPTATRTRILVARHGSQLRLRFLDDQYRGPQGTFSVQRVEEEGGGLRLEGKMSWSAYAALVAAFTVLALFGAGVLIFGDGTADALVLGWSMLILFGLVAVAGWGVYRKQLDYQQEKLSAALASAVGWNRSPSSGKGSAAGIGDT